jgi:hypothetical protein
MIEYRLAHQERVRCRTRPGMSDGDVRQRTMRWSSVASVTS